MAPLVRSYYRALVTKGSVYAINNKPWTIYDSVSGSNTSTDNNDKARWTTVGYKEILNGSKHSGKYTMGRTAHASSDYVKRVLKIFSQSERKKELPYFRQNEK